MYENTKAHLTDDHIKAINRPRRIIFQDDVLANAVFRNEEVGKERLGKIVNYYMSRLDDHPNQIDSVWHEWGEGNTAVWPSKILPRTENIFPKWWEAGIDPVKVLLSETRKRGREVFFSYRINGSDNDDLFDPPHPFDQPIPLKAKNPDWLLHLWHTYWNFANEGVRDLKLKIVREVAEMYDFDGIHIDFARIPVLFPAGGQWEHRDLLTGFMRQVRMALLEVEQQRGRPLLLAARVSENLMGCHFDGMDVETWAGEHLVDILVLGTRTANVDVAAFRRITVGTPIKLYPCWDDIHSSDGYAQADIEIFRGVYANWWRQKPDGMHTFNLMLASRQSADSLGVSYDSRWPTQCRIFNDIGSPDTLKGKDKVFFVERRGGGHGEQVVPGPSNWHTPRHMYFQTNMHAPLPAVLDNEGRVDTLLTLNLADDVNAESESVDQITLRLTISIGDEEGLAANDTPKESGEQIEVRINNILLGRARVETRAEGQRLGDIPQPAPREVDWFVFPVSPRHLAVDDNLIGVRLSQPPHDAAAPVKIEKLELHVRYRQIA